MDLFTFVSHIVTMYMMPQLGLIIALEPDRKSGFQHYMHPEYSSSDNSSAFYHVFFFLPMKMTFGETVQDAVGR